MILNYTTGIAATKTISEMQKLLAGAGASRISVDYEVATATGMSFELQTPHGERSFNLPVDVQAMRELLVKYDRQGKLKSGSKAVRTSWEQAERVAWRVMKDWLAAQLTLVQSQMASLDQVMLPYLNVNGRSLYTAYKAQEQSVLELEASQ